MISAAFITGAALPTVRTSRPQVSHRSAPQMSVRQNLARIAAATPLTLATVAQATEGTGEGLGIDNPLLYLPLVLIPGLFLAFYLQFDGQQNKEDFFGAYDERRK